MNNVNRGSFPASAPTDRPPKPAGPDGGSEAVQILLHGQPHQIQRLQAGPDSDSILKALGGNPPSSSSSFAAVQTLAPQAGSTHAAALTTASQVNATDRRAINDGIDFLTELYCSAALGGQIFKAVIAELDVDPNRLGGIAERVDPRMREWFAEQRSADTGPVLRHQAHEELRTKIETALQEMSKNK